MQEKLVHFMSGEQINNRNDCDSQLKQTRTVNYLHRGTYTIEQKWLQCTRMQRLLLAVTTERIDTVPSVGGGWEAEQGRPSGASLEWVERRSEQGWTEGKNERKKEE